MKARFIPFTSFSNTPVFGQNGNNDFYSVTIWNKSYFIASIILNLYSKERGITLYPENLLLILQNPSDTTEYLNTLRIIMY